MNRLASLKPDGGSHSGPAGWAAALVRGDWRASLSCFVLLTAFYLATAAGNLSETDDVYAFAYRAEHFELGHLSDPRLMLYHIVMRLLFLASWAIGLNLSALSLMRGVSALCAAGTLLVVMRLVYTDLRCSTAPAVLAAALLASCYGFWRYAAEAEVYIPTILLILLVFRGLSALYGGEHAARRVRGVLVAAGWGAFAGLAVLFYQPSLIPLFFSFPLLLAHPKRVAHLLCYLMTGGAVVGGGYLGGFLVFWPEPLSLTAFASFLSQRSGEFMVSPLSLWTVIVSLIRAAFALTHDIASANWIFAIDPVAGLVRRAFSYNVITEEIFLAKRAGLLAYLPILTLFLLVVVALRILISVWPLSIAPLRRRRMLVILAWIGINGVIIGRLNPAGVEAWILILPPLVLVFAVGVIEPCLRKGVGRLIGGFVLLLFLHNALGGMALVFDPAGEYDRVKGAWVIEQAQPRDLVLVAGNAGLVESLRYLSSAEVALISAADVPEVAESLLEEDMSHLTIRTKGRDFSNQFLRSLIREAGQSGGRLILFDEFFKRPEGGATGDWLEDARLRKLQVRAVEVHESHGAGATYVLPAPAW